MRNSVENNRDIFLGNVDPVGINVNVMLVPYQLVMSL